MIIPILMPNRLPKTKAVILAAVKLPVATINVFKVICTNINITIEDAIVALINAYGKEQIKPNT